MKNQSKIVYRILALLMVLGMILASAAFVFAEPEQKDLITLDTEQDIVVLFLFDAEIVDIKFISPSETELTESDASVDKQTGDLWASYRIKNAEPGTWRVEYDLGRNKEIQYSVMLENVGIWVKDFKVESIDNGSVTLSFSADHEGERINYNYEILASDSTESAALKLYTGRASSGEECRREIDISSLSSGTYSFIVNVYYQDGEAEIFDSAITDPVDYVNPREPEALKDFAVMIDLWNSTCSLDWSKQTIYGCEGYRVSVLENDEEIYYSEHEPDTTENSIVFSNAAAKITVRLSYKRNGLWSEAKTKTIDLSEEYIKLTGKDTNGSVQAVLNYKTAKERVLDLTVNGSHGQYRLDGESSLAFDQIPGENIIYAAMEADDNVYYVVDARTFFDDVPPEILLYEKLDGKTFFSDTVNILGQIRGGSILRIGGTDIEIDENGNFSHAVSLSSGENTVEIEAEDANGNISKMVLTLYKGSSGPAAQHDGNTGGGIKRFIPLMGAGLASLVIIVLSVLFMKKREADAPRKGSSKLAFILTEVLFAACGGVCVWQYIKLYKNNNSISFIDLAERSAAKAFEYLRQERLFGIAAVVCIAAMILTLVIFLLRIRKKSSEKETFVNN